MSFNLTTVGEFFCILYLIKFKRKKNRCLGFTSSTKGKIRQSHVVHSRKTAKKYTKKRDGRAKCFFFSVIVLVLFDSSLFKFSSLLLLDVLSSTFNEHPATDGGFSLMQEFLLDFFKRSPTCAFKN